MGRSSSRSSTSNTTSNSTNNVQTESGIQIVDSAGSSIVLTDRDAVQLSFQAIEDVVSDALEVVENQNERIETINNRTVGTLRDFATDATIGDFDTTRNLAYLAGGLVTVVVLAVIVAPRLRSTK